jgi:arginine/ornithine N-succinyltransferase beta subunit
MFLHRANEIGERVQSVEVHSCCENISGRANFCVACEETEGVIAANGPFLTAAAVMVVGGQRDRVPRPLAQDLRGVRTVMHAVKPAHNGIAKNFNMFYFRQVLLNTGTSELLP